MDSESTGSRQESLVTAWGVAAVSGLVMVLLLAFLLRPSPAPEPPPLLRASVSPPASSRFGDGSPVSGSQISVSPDGEDLAFVADNRLWLRPLGSVEARPLSGTEGGQYPFWSPEGESLGFFADGQLKRMAMTGGSVSVICDAPDGRGGSWANDGSILFAPEVRGAIHRVNAEGGRSQAVTELETSKHSTHRWPVVLADGRSFLFFAASHSHPRGPDTGVYLATLEGGTAPRLLTRSESKPVISAGYLLFLHDGDLRARRFDRLRNELVGETLAVESRVRYRGSSWDGMFSASRQEVLAFERGTSERGEQLIWVDRLGNVQATVGEPGVFWDLRVAPQGDRLAVATGSTEPVLWIYELGRGQESRLKVSAHFSRAPVWSPEGDRLAFAAMNADGRLGIHTIPAGGGEEAKPWLVSETDQVPTSWSPDGRWLAFDRGIPGATEIWIAPVDGNGDAEAVIEAPPWAADGQFSPDGKWLLYTSSESGEEQVVVARFSDPRQRWQVSASNGSSHGRWSPSGERVYFATAQGILMEVEIRARKGGDLDIGMPRMLYSYRLDDSNFRVHHDFYDVVGTEERFLLAQALESNGATAHLTLVLPWWAVLESEP